MNDKVNLVNTEKGLTLKSDDLEIRADFSEMANRLKGGAVQGEMLVKCAKIKGETRGLTAVDATAGFGEDSALLAAAGFNVIMFERDPVIAALLKDALSRGKEDPKVSAVVNRLTLIEGDSIEGMKNLDVMPDVILLDPMFPKRTKSAQVKKKFQLIHELEAPCTDEKELLDAAMSMHPKKLIIKRPLKGPFLADMKPSYSLEGKAIRYDCFVNI